MVKAGEQGRAGVLLPRQDGQEACHDEGQGQEGHEDGDLPRDRPGPHSEPEAAAAAVQEREAAEGHDGAEGAGGPAGDLLQGDRHERLPRRRPERNLDERQVLVPVQAAAGADGERSRRVGNHRRRRPEHRLTDRDAAVHGSRVERVQEDHRGGVQPRSRERRPGRPAQHERSEHDRDVRRSQRHRPRRPARRDAVHRLHRQPALPGHRRQRADLGAARRRRRSRPRSCSRAARSRTGSSRSRARP